MQRTVGNRAVGEYVESRSKGCACGKCGDPQGVAVTHGSTSLPEVLCTAQASYPAPSWVGPGRVKQEDGTFRAKGKLKITIPKPLVNIDIPQVPSGLSPCQAKLYKAALDGPLAKHEKEHKKLFEETGTANAYAGSVTLDVDNAGTNDEIDAAEKAAANAEAAKRKALNEAHAKSIDPYKVKVDTSACTDVDASSEESVDASAALGDED